MTESKRRTLLPVRLEVRCYYLDSKSIWNIAEHTVGYEANKTTGGEAEASKATCHQYIKILTCPSVCLSGSRVKPGSVNSALSLRESSLVRSSNCVPAMSPACMCVPQMFRSVQLALSTSDPLTQTNANLATAPPYLALAHPLGLV